MPQIEVSFSAFLTIFVHFWPILAQYFDLYSTKILFWAYFGTQGTPLAILHTPKSCLVALNGLKRAKNWLKLMFHFLHFSPFSSIFGPIWLNILTWIVPIFRLVIFENLWDGPSHPTPQNWLKLRFLGEGYSGKWLGLFSQMLAFQTKSPTT